MLISDYKLEINWEKGCCGQWQSVTVKLSEDISQALPRLVSAIEDARYEPTEKSLRLIKDSRYIYIYPKRIYISHIQSSDEAHALMEWTKDVLNEAYSESTKVTESKRVK